MYVTCTVLNKNSAVEANIIFIGPPLCTPLYPLVPKLRGTLTPHTPGCAAHVCTGLTFLNVSNTRLVSQSTAVCRVRRPSTLPTVVVQSQRLLADATYARPVDITCQYHVIGSLPSAVKPSLLQARQSGTLTDSL